MQVNFACFAVLVVRLRTSSLLLRSQIRNILKLIGDLFIPFDRLAVDNERLNGLDFVG